MFSFWDLFSSLITHQQYLITFMRLKANSPTMPHYVYEAQSKQTTPCLVKSTVYHSSLANCFSLCSWLKACIVKSKPCLVKSTENWVG